MTKKESDPLITITLCILTSQALWPALAQPPLDQALVVEAEALLQRLLVVVVGVVQVVVVVVVPAQRYVQLCLIMNEVEAVAQGLVEAFNALSLLPSLTATAIAISTAAVMVRPLPLRLHHCIHSLTLHPLQWHHSLLALALALALALGVWI